MTGDGVAIVIDASVKNRRGTNPIGKICFAFLVIFFEVHPRDHISTPLGGAAYQSCPCGGDGPDGCERKVCPQATSDQRPASASFPRQIGIKATVARQISAAAVSRLRTAHGGCLTHPVPIGAWQRTRVHGCAIPAGDACTFQSALSTMTAPGLQTVISMRSRVRSPASAHAIKELPGNCLTA